MSAMNSDEAIAEKYLKSKFNNISFEPDGNIPPDFTVDNKIGVEVRRLNQKFLNPENQKFEDIEKQGIPFVKTILEELSKYPVDSNGNNFWVAIDYERNIGKARVVKKNLANAISAFKEQGEKIPFKYSLSRGVTLEFIAQSKNLKNKYSVGIQSDYDSGGFIVGEYIQSISHCMFEKEGKVKSHLSKYKTWWLLLVDHIGGIDNDDYNDIVTNVLKSQCFEKVLIVNMQGNLVLSF